LNCPVPSCRGGYRGGGRWTFAPPLTDSGRGGAKPLPEFGIFVPIFRIASQ